MSVCRPTVEGVRAEALRRYPEHEKLRAAKDEFGTEAIHAFLEWCREQRLCLASDDEAGELRPHPEPERELLARYAGVDLRKLADEKDAMVEELRAAAGGKP